MLFMWLNIAMLSWYFYTKHKVYFEVKWKWLFATPWTLQSMEFSRQEYWSGKLFLSPGDFPNPGVKPRSPTLRADSLLAEPQGKPRNTGVGSLSLLHGSFLTQESKLGSPAIAGWFFPNWAIREAIKCIAVNVLYALECKCTCWL